MKITPMSEKSAVVFIGSNSQEVRFLSVLKRYTPDYVLDSSRSKAAAILSTIACLEIILSTFQDASVSADATK
jgi:hypothetical protein